RCAMRVCVYPRQRRGDYDNGYIDDFCRSLVESGVTLVGEEARNPLLSLFRYRKVDCYVFHWIENVPNYKWGLMQSAAAWLIVRAARLCGRKVVWFMHNRRPHSGRRLFLCSALMRLMAAASDVIVTHSREGVGLVAERYPHRLRKVRFIDHPTKNRLSDRHISACDYDLLIWGTVSPYKNVDRFVEYAAANMPGCRILVVGRCQDDALLKRIVASAGEYIEVWPRPVSFEELGGLIARSRYVLVPYASQTLLSSGTLMDSLSFGARVIGPNVGSFADYAADKRVEVRTYDSYDDIKAILAADDRCVDMEGYADFLEQNSWRAFARRFVDVIR
ncbi:MAG: glycosyltransferase family 1 protein, partial [Rikenellaceae bacterium]|nr:glycosyltransferase family 1 protein [Rikenellaceae bacterium]